MYSAVVAQGDKSLEDEETQWWAIRSWQRPVERIIEADPLTATGEVAEEFNIDPCTVIQHLKQIGKVKKLNKLVLHELTTKKKVVVLKCHFLLFRARTTKHILIRLWHVMKSGFYTTGDNQLSGWIEKKLQSTSQSQECTKKKGHGHCLVVCCWSDPWQLSES